MPRRDKRNCLERLAGERRAMASLLELGAQIASVYRKKGPVRDANARPACHARFSWQR